MEAKPLLRIKRISGVNLARNWMTIPHVTHHYDSDMTHVAKVLVDLRRTPV